MKAHPLTKLQLWIALIWAVSFCLVESVSGPNLLFLISMVLFVGLGIITFWIGWLMVIKKTNVIYPFQDLGIRYVEKSRGEQAAKDLVVKYSQPWWRMTIGVLNLFSGLLCFFMAVFGIVASLQAL